MLEADEAKHLMWGRGPGQSLEVEAEAKFKRARPRPNLKRLNTTVY